MMKWRQELYFILTSLREQRIGKYYKRFMREDVSGIHPDVTKTRLVQILKHCQQSVPYYAEIMRDIPNTYNEDPEEYLLQMPILTKDILRNRFEDLKSADLNEHKWFTNTSGGSTGEPVLFIQDCDYAAQSGAIKQLFSKLVGREIGELEIYLWGSKRDFTGATEGFRARFVNWLTNTNYQSIFRMTPDRMRELVDLINTQKPKLIVAYTNTLYDFARYVEKEGIEVFPQNAIIVSAYTLYPHMRSTIEKVFQCKVYNRYGSREVGDVACERPGHQGLWVAPWGSYLEVVDQDGNRVPDGTPGEILVTSLKNFAMPLIRYKIGDIGVLAPAKASGDLSECQFLQELLGRSNDNFINKNGMMVTAGHFMPSLYFRDWIVQYQVIQKRPELVVMNFVISGEGPDQVELDEIAETARVIMGAECEIQINFVPEILPSPSGKFRYIYSEVTPP